jgi:hypothetical protein
MYQVMLRDTIDLQVQPDGQAIIRADQVTRQRDRTDQQRMREQQPMQRQQQMQQRQRGDQTMLRGQVQQLQQTQDMTQLRLRDQQTGQTYTVEFDRQVELHVKQTGEAGLVGEELTRDGQRTQLQATERDQQIQHRTIRGQIQQADQNRIQIQGADGRQYTLELGEQTQVRATQDGRPIVMGERLTRDGQEVRFQDLQQQQR